MKKNIDRKVVVCSACLMASCWYGEFMCERSRIAKTKKMKISELKKLGLEHSSYWSEEKVKAVCG